LSSAQIEDGPAMPHELPPPRSRSRAKAMRRALTPAELKLWNALRAHRMMGLGFRRQMTVGPYIADFACPSHRLIIELDGSQHGAADLAARDEARTVFLQASGWTVLRFWNDDVLRDIDGVCGHIVIAAGLMAADAQAYAAAPHACTVDAAIGRIS